VVFCNDICFVIEAVGHQHDPNVWSLFIDSSKVSLKIVLLHNGNNFTYVPLVHAVDMKDFYENTKILLEKIQYDKYNFNICRYLKVIALLFGLQLSYTKICCFLCEWDSGTENNSTSKNGGLKGNRLFQERTM
jgi:hypothetical protein